MGRVQPQKFASSTLFIEWECIFKTLHPLQLPAPARRTAAERKSRTGEPPRACAHARFKRRRLEAKEAAEESREKTEIENEGSKGVSLSSQV